MKFAIRNRWTGSVIFEAEIEADENTYFGIRVGLAVKKAIEARADLTDAVLTRAVLTDVKNVGDFRMTDGMKFNDYKRDVVPALLTAGGKTMAEIQASNCWECHDWGNCPMHVAFGITSPDQGPPLLRARIKEFVQFFDARLIPAPWAADGVTETTTRESGS